MSEKPKRSEEGPWQHQPTKVIGALVLIALGVIFLLDEAGIQLLGGNWWAIFILLPGLYLFWRAYEMYRVTGSLSGETASYAGGGVIVLTVGMLALTDNWDLWPLILIAAGIAALLNAGKRGEA